jgi:peptidoglycan/LPS O-acetylase OafA/YrhL
VDVDARARLTTTGHLPSNGARIVELDALRGIAVAAVIGYHYISEVGATEQTPLIGMLTPLFRSGWLGVDLFFVLSGFLIGSILFEHAGKPNFFQTFYIRRAARLMPLYFLVVGLYFLTSSLVATYGSAAASNLLDGRSPLPWWSYVLYLQNIMQASSQSFGSPWLVPTWSLAVEEQFYILAPLFISVMPRSRMAVGLVTLIAAAVIYRIVTSIAGDHWLPTHLLLQCRADSLLIGMVGALALANPRVRSVIAKHTDILKYSLWATAALLAVITLVDLKADSQIMATVGYTVLAALSLNMIFAALFSDGWFRKSLLSNQRFIQLGHISYAAYLLHEPMLVLVTMAAGQPNIAMGHEIHLAQAAAAFVLTVSLAQLSAVYIERPFLALGRRFSYDQQPAVAQPA